MCNIDLQSVATIKYTDVRDIVEHINGLFKKDPEFIPQFKMDGVTYGFVPVLDEMTFGEYIDVDENMSSWDTIHKAMAVLFRPVTHQKDERYDIEPYKAGIQTEKFKQMPIDVCLGANFFFLNLGMELLETTLNCSGKEMNMTMEEKQLLLANGVGFRASLDLLKETLQDLNISPDSTFTNAS